MTKIIILVMDINITTLYNYNNLHLFFFVDNSSKTISKCAVMTDECILKVVNHLFYVNVMYWNFITLVYKFDL